eukprot:5714008-Amphidinium_carterae.1
MGCCGETEIIKGKLAELGKWYTQVSACTRRRRMRNRESYSKPSRWTRAESVDAQGNQDPSRRTT